MDTPQNKCVCEKCNGTGIIKDKNGSVHTCYDCLNSDRLEQHGHPKDSNIRW